MAILQNRARASGASEGSDFALPERARAAGERGVVKTVEEARRVAAQISDLSQRIREIPGLDGGHVERVYSSIHNLIQEYQKRPYWHYRFMLRELDQIAAEVKRLAVEGALAAEHLELFDLALYRLKNRRFRSAVKHLRKIKDGVALVRERGRLLEDYRPFRREMEEQSKALEEEILRLRSVPAPPAGPSDVEAAERLVAECNAASAAALRTFLTRSPGRDVVRLCLRMGPDPALRFLAPPRPEDARELLRILDGETDSGELARRSLYDLLEAAGYSEARLAHLAPNARRLRLLLQANTPWLRSLSGAWDSGAVKFALQEPPEVLGQRIPPLLRFLSEVPGSEEAVLHLGNLLSLVETGRLAPVQRSAEIYARHGEGARKRWEGALEPEISQKVRALDGLRRDLSELPAPEKL